MSSTYLWCFTHSELGSNFCVLEIFNITATQKHHSFLPLNFLAHNWVHLWNSSLVWNHIHEVICLNPTKSKLPSTESSSTSTLPIPYSLGMTISSSPSLTQSRDQYTEQVHNIGQSSLKICTSVQPVQGNPHNELNVRKWKRAERTGLVEGRVEGT